LLHGFGIDVIRSRIYWLFLGNDNKFLKGFYSVVTRSQTNFYHHHHQPVISTAGKKAFPIFFHTRCYNFLKIGLLWKQKKKEIICQNISNSYETFAREVKQKKKEIICQNISNSYETFAREV